MSRNVLGIFWNPFFLSRLHKSQDRECLWSGLSFFGAMSQESVWLGEVSEDVVSEKSFSRCTWNDTITKSAIYQIFCIGLWTYHGYFFKKKDCPYGKAVVCLDGKEHGFGPQGAWLGVQIQHFVARWLQQATSTACVRHLSEMTPIPNL